MHEDLDGRKLADILFAVGQGLFQRDEGLAWDIF
jgi:hypothetical protein